MIKIHVISILFLLSSFVFGQDIDSSKIDSTSTSEFNFRKTHWGMTINEVKATEDSEPADETDKYLLYENQLVANLKTSIGYRFSSGKLVIAKYIFEEDYANAKSYKLSYDRLNDVLSEKYGPPNRHEEVWLDPLFKDAPDQIGTAIALGDVILFSIWNLGDTNIAHGVDCENKRIRHIIEYSSTTLEPLLEKENKDQNNADF